MAPDRERCAAPPPAADSLAALRALRLSGGRWAVVMLRGGHFAAAVFTVDPARVANPRQPDKFEALAHKSAHRYVVRWAGGMWSRVPEERNEQCWEREDGYGKCEPQAQAQERGQGGGWMGGRGERVPLC